MNDAPYFIDPRKEYAAPYIEALKEGLNIDPTGQDELNEIETHFESWYMDKRQPKNGPVPQTLRWLVRDDQFVGRVSIRHFLNDKLKIKGGHIGYAVSPLERKKGYGHLLLKEGLRVAAQLKIKPVLVTCNDNNIGSIKIIETLGGTLIKKGTPPDHGQLIRYYHISTRSNSFKR